MESEGAFLLKRPGGILSPHIQCFWISKSPKTSPPSKSLLLPDGNTEIVFNLGDPEKILSGREGANWGVIGGSRLIAGRKDSLFLEQTGSKYKIGIRFFPGGLAPFLPIPLDGMSNAIIDLGDLLGSDCGEMEERLLQARSAAGVFEILQRKMLSRFDPDYREDRIVDLLIRRIRLSRGDFSLKRTAKQLGVDSKSLRRWFAAKVGFMPKIYSRIVRFQALLKEIGKEEDHSWTSFACQYGFYDQSHFIKEFKSFSGMTPSQFITEHVPIIR